LKNFVKRGHLKSSWTLAPGESRPRLERASTKN
jgi:hypothetical protein